MITLFRGTLFCSCSAQWYKNCPLSMMESKIYGTPILRTNIGGISELIENCKKVELFESGNVEDLVNKSIVY